MLIPRLYGSDIEAYSWGVGEYESEGLDVGDDLLDLVADLVDGFVVGPVVRVERQVWGFSFQGDHSQSDVPLVANVPGR